MCIWWQHEYVHASYYVRWIQKSIFNKYYTYIHIVIIRGYFLNSLNWYEQILIHHEKAVIPKNVSFTLSTTDRQSSLKKIVISMMVGGGS